MRNLLPTLFFVFTFTFLNAQLYHEGQCGMMPDEDLITRLLANKEAARLNDYDRNDSIFYVPVQLHLVAKDDGSGRMKEKDALKGLCKLNQDYAPLNMVFYIKEDFNYIDMSAMYDLQFPNVPWSVNSAYSSNKVPNAINIYVGNGLSSGNSGYYTSQYDIILYGQILYDGESRDFSSRNGAFFQFATYFFWMGINDLRSYSTNSIDCLLGQFHECC